MEENISIATVLYELREFRTENNKRWDENDKRWEENERRWEANDKRWEENERRWEANDKRWEENERRWEANDKRWEENERRWEENEKRWEANEKRLSSIEERTNNLEINRKNDKNEIIEVLDIMQKSIDKQFKDLENNMNNRFEKIEDELIENRKEHQEFRKKMKRFNSRLDFHSARISSLEKWREDINNDGFVGIQ